MAFTAGQKVFLKAGLMMRSLGGDTAQPTLALRGQQIELTEEEAGRWDADLIFAATEDDLGGPEAATPEEGGASTSISDMTADEAKAWASSSDRTDEELEAALEEEENGKNRSTVIAAIEAALAEE